MLEEDSNLTLALSPRKGGKANNRITLFLTFIPAEL
jgi:hypothetical protein